MYKICIFEKVFYLVVKIGSGVLFLVNYLRMCLCMMLVLVGLLQNFLIEIVKFEFIFLNFFVELCIFFLVFLFFNVGDM